MSDRHEEKNGQPSATRYRSGDLVLVRFGATGTQLAEVRQVSGQQVLVRKWQNASGRFAEAKWCAARLVVGRPAKGDPRVPLAMAAMKSEV